MDIVNFKITHHIYGSYVQLKKELLHCGYKVDVQPYCKIDEKLNKNPNARITFKELFEEYHRLRTTQSVFVWDSDGMRAQIERRNPLVKHAYEKLGVDTVKALKYNVGNIRRELDKQLPISIDAKIIKMLNDTLPKQKPIPKSEIKMRIQKIYDALGVKLAAKATDLAK